MKKITFEQAVYNYGHATGKPFNYDDNNSVSLVNLYAMGYNDAVKKHNAKRKLRHEKKIMKTQWASGPEYIMKDPLMGLNKMTVSDPKPDRKKTWTIHEPEPDRYQRLEGSLNVLSGMVDIINKRLNFYDDDIIEINKRLDAHKEQISRLTDKVFGGKV